jgi:aryl-alcohol dehydrogenase-like predicted oxidoreductase
MQFVLRLSPEVHRKIDPLQPAIAAGKVDFEGLRAYSTYVHETIHWWQHIGSTTGLMLSLSYPGQSHANHTHLRNLLTQIGPKKSIRQFVVGAETIRRANKAHPISAMQSEYSVWERGIEESILPAMRELGIGLVPFSPLGRGYLTGALQSSSVFGPGDFRRHLPRFNDEHMAANQRLVDTVRAVARRHGTANGATTLAQVALAWVLAAVPDAVPIPGTKRRSYLDENLGALSVHLTAEDMTDLNQLASQVAGDRYLPAMAKLAER